MSLWTFFLGGTVFLGLFLTAGTLAGSGPRAARAWLALLLFSVSVFLLEFLVMQSGYYGFPVVFLTYPLVFVMGPAFFLLARAQLHPDADARPADALHALPALLAAGNQLPYYRDALAAGTARGLRPELLVPLGGYEMMGLHLAQLGVYVLLGTRLLRRRARAQGDVDSGAIVDQARWLAGVGAGLAAIVAVQLLATALMAATGRHIDRHEYATALSIGSVILGVGWTVLRHGRLLAPPRGGAPDRYRKSPLARDRAEEYRRRLLEHVARARPYLDPDLRLDALARAVGIPAHHLSQTLNQAMGMTFFDFVNRARVRHAADLLLHPRDPEQTVLAVALDSGFSSKASFNRAFKTHTGLTPSQFRLRASDSHPVFGSEIGSHPAG